MKSFGENQETFFIHKRQQMSFYRLFEFVMEKNYITHLMLVNY